MPKLRGTYLMIKWIKKLIKLFNDRPDVAIPTTFRPIHSLMPPLDVPSLFESTPYGHYQRDFLIWAFGEVPALQPQQHYIDAWNKRYANLYLIPQNEDLALLMPKL